jgi:hypothetical protein
LRQHSNLSNLLCFPWPWPRACIPPRLRFGFRVNPFPQDVTISLTANPPSVPNGTPFTLGANLSISNPLGIDLWVPLRVSLGGGISVWFGEPLKIASGQRTGEVTIGEPLVPGTYTWVASLAGRSTDPVSVEVT